jgi:hypothetical protein
MTARDKILTAAARETATGLRPSKRDTSRDTELLDKLDAYLRTNRALLLHADGYQEAINKASCGLLVLRPNCFFGSREDTGRKHVDIRYALEKIFSDVRPLNGDQPIASSPVPTVRERRRATQRRRS